MAFAPFARHIWNMSSLFGVAAGIVGVTLPRPASGQSPRPREFVYADFDRYNAAYAAIRGGADTLVVFQRYLDSAAAGFRAYVGIYPTTAGDLAAELRRRPRYYGSLAALRPRVAALEPEVARAYARLEALHPGADLGSVHYFVAVKRAGGTARGIGSLVAVEQFGRTAETDTSEFRDTDVYDLNVLAQITIHEAVHNLQRQMQGEPNFISIHTNPARMTMRKFAGRHAFADPREAAIWAEFQPVMDQTIMQQPGWFQGRFADSRVWPIQVGYFVGYKMAEHYHRNAANREQALKELLSPYTDEQFAAIAARYAEKFSGR
ncbi:MAG: hypothetical protein HOP28_09470 [Gemmatimonadales bacterium]|nr:hypothetical protein [Gemmatimonadales bacterium]